MENNVYIVELLDAYKPLLTEKQADILALYYEEDLSLAEITEHYQITRQAVLDNIKRAEKQLLHYEEKLGLVKIEDNRANIISQIRNLISDLPENEATQIEAKLRELEDLIDGI